MGMAASQARFLQLTARKSNIEFMGQQINQQRVSLANQSAGLFEKMLTLDPPVPPSSLDDKYYTQGYTFKDSVEDDGTAVFRGDEMSKKITWSTTPPAGMDTSLEVVVTDNDLANGGATVSDTTLAFDLSTLMGEANEEVASTGQNLQDFMTAVGFTEQDDTTRSVVRYVTIEHNAYDPDGNYITVQEQSPAILEFDNLERLVNFTLLGVTNDGSAATEATLTATGDFGGVGAGNIAQQDFYDELAAGNTTLTGGAQGSTVAVGQGEELTYSGQFDEVAYNDDMNKYEFEKSAYDYQIERINVETAQIQKQDKSLELKMKQLDTEHRAVQTEMEAVQKVIQKNVESSFKTFA